MQYLIDTMPFIICSLKLAGRYVTFSNNPCEMSTGVFEIFTRVDKSASQEFVVWSVERVNSNINQGFHSHFNPSALWTYKYFTFS